jgi:DNA invertase Pin-like site-specific DNA recombinase
MNPVETTRPGTPSAASPGPVPRALPTPRETNDSLLLTLPVSKIKDWHRERKAVVYVRQLSAQQVLEHRESGYLQYGLAERATLFGWPSDRVEVVDEDQAHSGQTAAGRSGFQYLVAEVSLDHVGIIFGWDMSRLARSNKDWHQLLEVCAIFKTLLADQDGIYDPTDFNDRLLLGLKGAMSEAELHILKNRMYQGLLNKARRGEVYNHAPAGYIKSPAGKLLLDPDEQVQGAIRLIFEQFERQGTLQALLRWLVKNGVKMPIRPLGGPNRGQLEWHRPNRPTLQNLLKHPIYAGYYRWGHREIDPRRKVAGRPQTGRTVRSPHECLVLLENHCPAYITQAQFWANQKRLEENRARTQSLGAVRYGPSLLGGCWCAAAAAGV